MSRRCAFALSALAAALSCGPARAVDDAVMRACRAITDVAARVACYDGIPLPPATAAAPGPAPAAEAEARFGAAQLPVAPRDELQAISSSIPGDFAGWDAATRWTLANGQVWAIADGSRGVYRLKDPKVVISRGMLGSFFIEIEGVSRTPRVRRVQ